MLLLALLQMQDKIIYKFTTDELIAYIRGQQIYAFGVEMADLFNRWADKRKFNYAAAHAELTLPI